MAFKIEDGVLKKYIQEEGVKDLVIPDGVTVIEPELCVFVENECFAAKYTRRHKVKCKILESI